MKSLRLSALLAAVLVAFGSLVPYARSLMGLFTFLSTPNHPDLKPADVFYLLILPIASLVLIPFFYAMIAIEANGRTPSISSRAAAILNASVGSLTAALTSLYVMNQGSALPPGAGLVRIVALIMPAFLLAYGVGMAPKLWRGLAWVLVLMFVAETAEQTLRTIQWFRVFAAEPGNPWAQYAAIIMWTIASLVSALLASAAQLWFFFNMARTGGPGTTTIAEAVPSSPELSTEQSPVID